MSNIRLKMKRDGLYNLRREPGVKADLEARGKAVLDACGGEAVGYMMASQQGAKKPQGRWRVSVFTSNIPAMLDNRRHNTLIKNFGAANG